MALTQQQDHIQDFLTACERDTPVPGIQPAVKTRAMVNNPTKHDELKAAFGMNDADHIIYEHFWADFFDLANYIGPTKASQATTISCCCSCCL